MNGSSDAGSYKRQRASRILIVSGILILVVGGILCIVGVIEKLILEALSPGLIIDNFPPIGLLVIGITLCVLGIFMRDTKSS